jgi:hypothetical protein
MIIASALPIRQGSRMTKLGAACGHPEAYLDESRDQPDPKGACSRDLTLAPV